MRRLFQALSAGTARVLIASTALAATAALSAPIELKLVGKDGNAIGGTVVMLRSADASRPLAKPVDAVMIQKNMEFSPHVLVVPTGSKVTFPNNDTVQHQVYSNSQAKRLDIGLYKGTPKPEVFDLAGVVTLGCNIHDNMLGYIYVVDAQYYGRMDASGSWKGDVQPGTYTVQIWHPRSSGPKPVIDQQIKVSAGEPSIVLRVLTPLRLRPDSQVPANWDAY